jgi:hypothetical protein
MKKTVLLFVSLFLLFGMFAALPVASEESDMYYKTATIIKVFPHKLGYYVIYRSPTSLKSSEFFIPTEWFDRRDSRAVLNLTDQHIAPYLAILTKAGKFDHIRITLPKDVSNSVWGTLTSGVKYNDKFTAEELKLEY